MKCLTTRVAVLAVLYQVGLTGCVSNHWPAYRHDGERSGTQRRASALSDAARVPSLAVRWTWEVPVNREAFRASPVVHKGRVYIGNGNGYFYALDASTGAVLWQYPAATDPALTSAFVCNFSSHGIASSAALARIKVRWFWFFKRKIWIVIFGAPDRSLAPGLGSGRLFALNATTGAVIWKSPALAAVTGTTPRSTGELHEQLGYSSPLVSGGRVYVGVGNHCDNPIQNGRIVAVDVRTGALVGGFAFTATGARGGGVWSSTAGDATGLYVTTGNTRCWGGGCQPEPSPNHGLSMLRLDRGTGAVTWKLQPVPFALDDDPDWAAGATLMRTSCGPLAASVMKDGWAYAVERGSGTPGPPAVRWQFPPTGFPFPVIAGVSHGDTHYKKPGAAWGDVLIVETGGYARVASGQWSGYGRLHALNACASESARVRWILDVPTASLGGYGLGAPAVTGGIVYVGTSGGRVVAIADPSVAPATGVRCSNTDYTLPQCVTAGYDTVPVPAVLANVAVSGGMWTEPALAEGKVFVTTDLGRVYMLSP